VLLSLPGGSTLGGGAPMLEVTAHQPGRRHATAWVVAAPATLVLSGAAVSTAEAASPARPAVAQPRRPASVPSRKPDRIFLLPIVGCRTHRETFASTDPARVSVRIGRPARG
jgi:hypothetical protein